MADNLRIWDALSKTDPKHTKPFSRPGGFKGTATKPIWLTMRLTEHFGPAGSGWGMEKPEFQTVTAGDEILVFCTVALWYTEEGKGSRGIVYGVGGDKVLAKRQSGGFTNDEAFKASYTDALSNAMKQIGVGADIHMGMFEDDKYLREVTAEFSRAEESDVENLAGPNAHRDQDGALLSTYEVQKIERAKTFADNAIQNLNLAPNRDAAKDWWREASVVPKGKKQSPIDWLKANSPGQFSRLQTAYENVVGLE